MQYCETLPYIIIEKLDNLSVPIICGELLRLYANLILIQCLKMSKWGVSVTFSAADCVLGPHPLSYCLVLGCAVLPFAGSLFSVRLSLCLGLYHSGKCGVHSTNS